MKSEDVLREQLQKQKKEEKERAEREIYQDLEDEDIVNYPQIA